MRIFNIFVFLECFLVQRSSLRRNELCQIVTFIPVARINLLGDNLSSIRSRKREIASRQNQSVTSYLCILNVTDWRDWSFFLNLFFYIEYVELNWPVHFISFFNPSSRSDLGVGYFYLFAHLSFVSFLFSAVRAFGQFHPITLSSWPYRAWWVFRFVFSPCFTIFCACFELMANFSQLSIQI